MDQSTRQSRGRRRLNAVVDAVVIGASCLGGVVLFGVAFFALMVGAQ